MSANVAFLTRLARIANDPACAEACARAIALVHAYETVLYVGLGIEGSQRLTAHAKETAKESLEALRRELLKSEIDARPPAAMIFAAARERLEMARHALALRVTAEDAGAPAAVELTDDPRRLSPPPAGRRDPRAATRSRDAIRELFELLGTS